MKRMHNYKTSLKGKTLYFLCLFLFLTFAMPKVLFAQEAAHIGTDFYLAFPDNYYDKAELYIQSEETANFTVTIINPAFSFTGTVSPGMPQTVNLPVLSEIRTNQVIENKGIHVTSDKSISVKFKSPVTVAMSEDAYLGLPKTTLGTEYIVLAYQETIGYPSEFALVGTEDGTTINITPSCTSIKGTPANTPFSITLNQGQTYQYQCGNKGDVTGTIITSNKPISVFGGNKCTFIPPDKLYCDYLVEQMFPTTLWGNDYLTFPLNNGTADLLRIIGGQDGTTVTINDGLSPATTVLNRGQFYEVTTERATHITSTQPILVAQYGRSAGAPPINLNRDPFMMLITPTDLFLKEYRLFIPTGYSPDFINIIASNSAVSTVTLEGQPVTGFTPLPGGNYQGVALPITVDGEHIISASEPIGVYIYGFTSYGSYGYPAGIAKRPAPSGFNAIRVIDTISTANIDLDQASFSKAPVSITTDTANNKTIIEWQFSSFSIGQIEKLNFDVILKNPIPGEDRLVNHKLELIYTDIAGNTIRKELGQQYVHVLNSNFNITPQTDKPEYNANENGIINLTITNIGNMARTVDIHINMVDAMGNPVALIAQIPNTAFAAGQTLTFPNITFNTGNTFSGPYQIQATLYEQTKPVGQGKTSVTIKSPLPQTGISSGISTNKMAYTVYEPVRISSVVTSQAANYIYNNLDVKVKITNSNGQQITELMRNIPTLMPSARNEGILYFDTGANPPGIYNITQQVYQGTGLISQSAANFTILSTQQTGTGITGQIIPMPKSLYRWQGLTINYNISNIGNTNLSDIGLKILIIDPETGAAQITLTDNISVLSINSNIANTKTIPSLDLPVTRQAKDYIIILQAMLPSGAATLASAAISVMPPIKITKEITGKPRALIWLCNGNNNNNNQSGQSCNNNPDPLEPIIKEALRQLNITYYLIVYNKKDYQRYLRSNEFNTYLIFNNHEPIEDHIDEELTEHINAGKGIIAFFIKKEEEHNNDDEKGLSVFGVKFKGYLPSKQRTLSLTQTEITDTDTITTSGKVERVEITSPSASIIASYNDGTPAIITNNYGLGKAILYTFDLRMTTQTATAEQLTNLIKKAINYTAPTKEQNIITGAIIPVTITIQNLGIPTTLKIEEILPPNTPATSDTAQRTGDRLYWEINLTTGETRKLTYYMIAPETPAITLITNTYYLTQNNLWQLYDQTELRINIKTNIAEIIAPIIEKLNSLTITDRKLDEERAEIIKILTELQNLTIQKGTKEAGEKLKEAISKALKAIEGLNEIKQELQKTNTLDPNTEKALNDIRYELDELLMLIEIWWYLYAEGVVMR